MNQIQQATTAARAATGMPIATRVRAGKVQVILATQKANGRYIADPLSDYLPADQAVAVLRQIEADRGFR